MDSRYAFLLISMSLEKAKEVLGFPPTSTPSSDEISKAYREKAFQVHPDRGGDPDVMVELNVAKDLLSGKGRPTYERAPSSEPATYEAPARPEKDEVSFNDAKTKAGIPADVDWKFVTDTQRGTGYSSDEFYRSETYWVAYGQTKTHHVFVGMSHKAYAQYFAGSRTPDRDIWFMKLVDGPIKGDEGTTPAWLYGQVMRVLKLIDFKGRFNSKIVDAKEWTFKEKRPTGTAMSIKNWLAETGEVDKDDPRVQSRKIVVEIMFSDSWDEKPGYAKAKYGRDYELITLIVNGKAYPLKEEDTKLITHKFSVKKEIFGDSVYDGTKKQVTRMPKAKAVKIMTWMLGTMKHLPDAAREALETAIKQKQ